MTDKTAAQRWIRHLSTLNFMPGATSTLRDVPMTMLADALTEVATIADPTRYDAR